MAKQKSLYEVSFVFFCEDNIADQVEGLPNVNVDGVYLDDDGDWNIECSAHVSVESNPGKATLDIIEDKMNRLLRYVPACWDYHYIKGVGNPFYWQP